MGTHSTALKPSGHPCEAGSLPKKPSMRTMGIVAGVVECAVAHVIPSQTHAMTWAYKDVYGITSAQCTSGAVDRAGYMNAKRYQSGCYVNSTTSAYDTNLATDFFRGGSLSVTGSYHWRNRTGSNYKVYSATDCMGISISIPSGQGVSTVSIVDRSVSTTMFEAQCRS